MIDNKIQKAYNKEKEGESSWENGIKKQLQPSRRLLV